MKYFKKDYDGMFKNVLHDKMYQFQVDRWKKHFSRLKTFNEADFDNYVKDNVKIMPIPAHVIKSRALMKTNK